MTIAILATIALVLFVYFLMCILEKEFDLFFLSNKNRLKDCIIEEEKAKVEYLQQIIDWAYEVLMKYREIFIGEEPMAEAQTLGYKSIAQSIIYNIEDKIIHEQYDQADKYLRQHCILIPQAIDA